MRSSSCLPRAALQTWKLGMKRLSSYCGLGSLTWTVAMTAEVYASPSHNIKRSFQCLHRLARVTIIAMEVANDHPVLVSTWPASIEWFHDFLFVANQVQALAYLRPGSREALGPELDVAAQAHPMWGHAQQVGQAPRRPYRPALVITLHDTAP